jgi:hypothetical protein
LKTFGLAIQHFADTLYPQYSERTGGVCLYKGQLPFSFPWDEEQEGHFREFDREREIFVREVCLEYLGNLANWVPEPIEPFLLLDLSSVQDPIELIGALSSERLFRFEKAFKGSRVPTRDWIWEEGVEKGRNSANVGLFVPSGCSSFPFLRQAFSKLSDYRLVHEETLIGEWDGLDFILASNHHLSREGKRKLLGFCAAGGTIVSLDAPLGVPNEVPLLQWDPSMVFDN